MTYTSTVYCSDNCPGHVTVHEGTIMLDPANAAEPFSLKEDNA
jgi:hypothetical protein